MSNSINDYLMKNCIKENCFNVFKHLNASIDFGGPVIKRTVYKHPLLINAQLEDGVIF
jgi:hypothetical protein